MSDRIEKVVRLKTNLKLDYETIIIGAGISGIGTGIQLKKDNMHSFCLLEKSEDLGGTWRDNKYPGVAVDIPSISYCYSFEPNPNWSRLFAPGEEILRYINHCVDKYNIRKHIRFRSQVEKMRFDTENNCWRLYLMDGSQLTSRFIISATGLLSQPITPDIKGLDRFKGKKFHTAEWDHHYDLSNKKVAVIGTGATAVQVIPAIAPQVAALSVFQRTPIWVSPKADVEFPKWVNFMFKYIPLFQTTCRLFTDAAMEFLTWSMLNYKKWPALIQAAQRGMLGNLDSQVDNEALKAQLEPKYGFGCKRPAISNEYWPTFNRDNVNLISDGIERITETGVITNSGEEIEVDLLILATGFKTQELGNAPSFEVFGLNQLELGQFWEDNRYQAFDGITVPNFPNFFLTFGPYTGGFNWYSMLEAQAKYISRCLIKANKLGSTFVEVKEEANSRYFQKMRTLSEKTLFSNASCETSRSYYFDANGDVSLPSLIIPMQRWLRVRRTQFAAYKFRS